MYKRRRLTEQDIVESPGLGSQDGGNTHLSSLNEHGEVNSSGASISSGPRLSRSSVGCVSVGSEGLSIGERLRDDIDNLFSIETEKLGGNSSRGDLDETMGRIKRVSTMAEQLGDRETHTT